jgi:Ser/Thr protein kinase RdoA (MazF antagonist)
LRHLHAALARISPGLRATLPSYLRELHAARTLLGDSASLPALPEDDRRLLVTTFDRLKLELDVLAPPDSYVVLHGSPHTYNVLLVCGEPRFIDFETACIGPVEWDLAHLEPNVVPFHDKSRSGRLLWVCRSMASVKTAAWCWQDVDRGDLRSHAEMHLAYIKEAVVPYL